MPRHITCIDDTAFKRGQFSLESFAVGAHAILLSRFLAKMLMPFVMPQLDSQVLRACFLFLQLMSRFAKPSAKFLVDLHVENVRAVYRIVARTSDFAHTFVSLWNLRFQSSAVVTWFGDTSSIADTVHQSPCDLFRLQSRSRLLTRYFRFGISLSHFSDWRNGNC